VCVVVKSHVLFFGEFSPLRKGKKKEKKLGAANHAKVFFFFEKLAQSYQILRKKSLKSPDLDYSLLPK